MTPTGGLKLLWGALAGAALLLSAATFAYAAELEPRPWRRCSLHTHTDDKLGTGVDGRIDAAGAPFLIDDGAISA